MELLLSCEVILPACYCLRRQALAGGLFAWLSRKIKNDNQKLKTLCLKSKKNYRLWTLDFGH
jgi:hypothetical protein